MVSERDSMGLRPIIMTMRADHPSSDERSDPPWRPWPRAPSEAATPASTRSTIEWTICSARRAGNSVRRGLRLRSSTPGDTSPSTRRCSTRRTHPPSILPPARWNTSPPPPPTPSRCCSGFRTTRRWRRVRWSSDCRNRSCSPQERSRVPVRPGGVHPRRLRAHRAAPVGARSSTISPHPSSRLRTTASTPRR